MKFLICIALAAVCLAKSGTEAADATPLVNHFLVKLGVDTGPADDCEKRLMVDAEQLLQKAVATGSECPYDVNFVRCVGPVIRDVRSGVADLESKASMRCQYYYSANILPQIFNWVQSVLAYDDATVVQMFMQIFNVPAPVVPVAPEPLPIAPAPVPVGPVIPVAPGPLPVAPAPVPVGPVVPVAPGPVLPVAPVAPVSDTPIVSQLMKKLGVDTRPADECEKGLMVEAEQLLQQSIEFGSECPFDANFVKCVGPVLRDVRSGVATLESKAQRNCQYYYTANILPQIFNWAKSVLANDDATVVRMVLKMML